MWFYPNAMLVILLTLQADQTIAFFPVTPFPKWMFQFSVGSCIKKMYSSLVKWNNFPHSNMHPESKSKSKNDHFLFFFFLLLLFVFGLWVTPGCAHDVQDILLLALSSGTTLSGFWQMKQSGGSVTCKASALATVLFLWPNQSFL